MACGEFGPGRLPEPEMVWLEIAELLGLDPGEAGARRGRRVSRGARARGRARKPERGAGKLGGLAGLFASIIPRSTPRRIADDEVDLRRRGVRRPAAARGGVRRRARRCPSPTSCGGPVLVAKGKAKAAPPTDLEAINHEVNPLQSAPEPLGAEAGAVADGFDPLEGQPDFDAAPEHRPLYGKHVLVTAGPTHEPIDPVRYIANRSSGKQGFAIAAAAAAAGARVTLVSGPVALATPPGVERIDVESAEEMAAAVKAGAAGRCRGHGRRGVRLADQGLRAREDQEARLGPAGAAAQGESRHPRHHRRQPPAAEAADRLRRRDRGRGRERAPASARARASTGSSPTTSRRPTARARWAATTTPST